MDGYMDEWMDGWLVDESMCHLPILLTLISRSEQDSWGKRGLVHPEGSLLKA
jgi:hypothetical protein